MQIDVFNGDADGICALVQLRLATTCPIKIGYRCKKDIQLLERLSVQKNDSVTVLDISLKKNRLAWIEFSSKAQLYFMLITMNRVIFRNIPILKRLSTL